MKQDVLVIGAFHEVIELTEKCGHNIIGIFDKNQAGSFRGYPILGKDEYASMKAEQLKKYPVIISPDQPEARSNLVRIYKELGFSFMTVISPDSTISRSALIGTGVTIQDGVNISAGVNISDFVRINSCANVMHDSKIGAFTTVAPNAVILGRVQIGSCGYIGANSTILPEKIIGNNVIIGAGSIVTHDIGDNKIVVGNPAREINK